MVSHKLEQLGILLFSLAPSARFTHFLRNGKQARASGERPVLETEELTGIAGQRVGSVFSLPERVPSLL